ncbi:MAG: hypothetical protein E7554_04865 [Ruminococcaceae bacterium]|nr:hypothetical protein [Oscillospiraceae bacterium]
MPVLTGSSGGAIWGVLLFGIACAVCCIVRADYAPRAVTPVDCLTAALYTLHGLCSSAHGDTAALIAADGAAVLLALLTIRGEKWGIARAAALTLLLVPARFCPMPPMEPLLALRLSALSGVLSSAGLFGAAVAKVKDESGRECLWLSAGAALGLI